MGGYIYANQDFIDDSNAFYAAYGPSTNWIPRLVGVDIDPVTGAVDTSVSYFCYYAPIYYGTTCEGDAGPIPTRPFVSIIGDRTKLQLSRTREICCWCSW